MVEANERKKLSKRIRFNIFLIFVSIFCLFCGDAVKNHGFDFSLNALKRLFEADIYFIFLFSTLEILCNRYAEGLKIQIGWSIWAIIAVFCYGIILGFDDFISKVVLVIFCIVTWFTYLIWDFVTFKKWLNQKQTIDHNDINDYVGQKDRNEDD